RDRAAEGEDDGCNEEEPGDEMEECSLRGVEEDESTEGSADEAGEGHGDGDAEVAADVVAIGSDGGELAGPESDGVGGIGLDGQDVHAQDCREEEERSSAGDGVEEASDECGDGEP